MRAPALPSLMSASSAAARGGPAALKQASGIIELRDYTIRPSEFKCFLNLSEEFSSARASVYKGFLGMFTADTGGNVSRVVHLYYFEDYHARDAARKAAAADAQWQRYTDAARTCLLAKESTILLQSPEAMAAAGVACASDFRPPVNDPNKDLQVVYELRKYQLHPGGGGVKKALSAFQHGYSGMGVLHGTAAARTGPPLAVVDVEQLHARLPSLPAKLAADGVGQLALVAYSDVGLMNQVFEIYRYPSAEHMIQACTRTRTAAAWQESKATVYSLCRDFSITLLHPASFSPWN
ncbi:Protein NipSnap 3A [Tetrabaena socialis]|uniref:Protein NipSnap 3A n=1 Tax=Tetrabaena socialis TaxID=47790 RepID=A0A2J8A8S7_9CHLO|nr:Protein NipSnap 3A [Tetrabaena socialis]|eukprot:PNH08905.1 Protein NipSnap 3A [Tetrabaena socialis]